MILASLLRWFADRLDPPPPGPEIVAVVNVDDLPLWQRVGLLLPVPDVYMPEAAQFAEEPQGRN